MRRWSIPILMYHAVSDETAPRFAPFAVTPAEFRAQMRYLAEAGYATMTMSEVALCAAGPSRFPPRPVALTFDDGFEDFAEAALPAMGEFGHASTLYAVGDRIGRTSDWLASIGEGDRRLMDRATLAGLRRHRVEVGAHGLTHVALDGLSGSDLRSEVAGSRARVEDAIGAPVDTFAYPFGFEGRRVREAVAEAGYRSACAVRYATARSCDPPLALPRHIVRRGTGVQGLARILSGGPPPVRLAFDRGRSRAYAAVRPILRRLGA